MTKCRLLHPNFKTIYLFQNLMIRNVRSPAWTIRWFDKFFSFFNLIIEFYIYTNCINNFNVIIDLHSSSSSNAAKLPKRRWLDPAHKETQIITQALCFRYGNFCQKSNRASAVRIYLIKQIWLLGNFTCIGIFIN